MRLGRTTVVRERAKVRSGVDLIAAASEITAAIIIAQVVAQRGLGAGAKRKDVRSVGSGLEDGITNHQGTAIPDGANKTGVAAQSTIGHGRRHAAVGIDAASAIGLGRIVAQSGIDQGHCSVATIIGGAANAATKAWCGVAAQSAIDHAQRRVANIIADAADAAAKVSGRIAAQSAIEHGQRRAAGDTVVIDSAAALKRRCLAR